MKNSFISTIETIVVGIVMSLLIMVFVGQSLEITGDSMYPTLENGERIVVEKVTYKSREPKRGEIIVFRSLQSDSIFLIKRVIAIPGDTLGITNGRITVNGEILDESYLPVTYLMPDLGVLQKYLNTPIPEGYLVVMGDNRRESYDSRMFGLIPYEKLVGKAFVAYWPPKEIKKF